MNNNRNFFITGLVVLLVIVGVFFLPKDKPSNEPMSLGPEMDRFAQCLTEKGAVEYGAYWCSACEAQKKDFGASFEYINYVECGYDPSACSDIQYTPTWILSDGERLVGRQPLEVLAEKTGCELPNLDGEKLSEKTEQNTDSTTSTPFE